MNFFANSQMAHELEITMSVLDVLVVNYNTVHLLQQMFDACIAASGGLEVRYWVLDNASTDDSVAVLKRDFPFAHLVVSDLNVGFGRANNQLLPFVRGDYALLLNTDAFVAPNTFQKTLSYMEAHPDVGVLGVRLVGRDGVLQPSCRFFPSPLNSFLARTGLSRFMPWVRLVDDMAWSHDTLRECDWVPGCYYLVRKAVLDQVGLFDPRYFLYCEEVDHCKRVRAAGWKVVYYPDTTVVHIGGESAKSAGKLSDSGRQLSALQLESELLYFRKHGGWFGLIQHLCLTALGTAYLILKDTVKRNGWKEVRQRFAHLALMFRLCIRTRWATRPTR